MKNIYENMQGGETNTPMASSTAISFPSFIIISASSFLALILILISILIHWPTTYFLLIIVALLSILSVSACLTSHFWASLSPIIFFLFAWSFA
jgi:hypothetical protein